mmetsp:Transcript_49006/g.135938  ORF Transcript_49006/g.135938 Transcript_49006/m.135938 type:complete len:101 (+) Transcript_49006:1029-1331(+)
MSEWDWVHARDVISSETSDRVRTYLHVAIGMQGSGQYCTRRVCLLCGGSGLRPLSAEPGRWPLAWAFLVTARSVGVSLEVHRTPAAWAMADPDDVEYYGE